MTATACKSSGSPETINVLLLGSAAAVILTSVLFIKSATCDASLAFNLNTRVPAVCRLTWSTWEISSSSTGSSLSGAITINRLVVASGNTSTCSLLAPGLSFNFSSYSWVTVVANVAACAFFRSYTRVTRGRACGLRNPNSATIISMAST